MNEKRLTIYLEDHLALIVGELELIERIRKGNTPSELGTYLVELAGAVNHQKLAVEEMLLRLGTSNSLSGQLKQGTAWLAEKLGRLKLNDSLSNYSDLSRVIELESLMATIAARIALWTTLDALSESSDTLCNLPPSGLAHDSEQQLQQIKQHHCLAVKQAFAPH